MEAGRDEKWEHNSGRREKHRNNLEDDIKRDLKENGWEVCTGSMWHRTEASGGLL
jgi:hypothetical protein